MSETHVAAHVKKFERQKENDEKKEWEEELASFWKDSLTGQVLFEHNM
jgi:hypothetical protein